MINDSKDFIYGELLACLYAAGDQVFDNQYSNCFTIY